MEKQDILRRLELLGDELEALQIRKPVRLLMIGGGYMLTQIGNRTITEDVDVLVHLDTQAETYRLFRAAVRYVAADTHGNERWLSDTIGDFLRLVGPLPQGRLWLKHAMLEVFIPEPQYILALKLLAGREKDRDDIEALLNRLKITRKRAAWSLLRRYIHREVLADYEEQVASVLATFLKK